MEDMGRINIHGDVGGQVVVGEHNIVINAQYGAQVSYRAEGPPRVRPRQHPHGPAIHRRAAALIGRDSELAAIGAWLAGGKPVQVFGPPGIGKSALLRRFAAGQATHGHLLVHLTATGLPMEDLFQEIFQACYETEDGRGFDGYKPEPATLRRHLGGLQVLLIIDDLQLSPEDMAVLLNTTRGCDLLTASIEWTAGVDSRPMRLEGLPEDAAFALLVRELGRTPYGYEGDVARRLIATVQGHAQTVVQTAAAMNAASRGNAASQAPWLHGALQIDQTALAVGAAARLSEKAAGLLRLLCALDPLPVSTTLLYALGERLDQSALAELTALRLIEADGDGFRSCGRFAALVAQQAGVVRDAAYLAPPLLQWLRTRATRREAGAEAAVIGRILAAAAWCGDHTVVRDLARAAAPLLALSLHWGMWGRVLEFGRVAAHTLGAGADEAYFVHEAQMRRIALGAVAMGAVGGGGGAGMAAADGSEGFGSGVQGSEMPSPGPHGSGISGHGSVGSRSARGAHRSLQSTVSSHPVAVGVGAVVLAASGTFGAVALNRGGGGPPPPPPPSSSTPSSTTVTSSRTDTTDPSTTGTGPSTSTDKPSSPSTTPPAGGRPVDPGGDPCPPVPLGTRDFGTVTIGEEKTETESFPWLECDDEKALKVNDQNSWKAALTSCPPASGEGEPCVFQVTFSPTKPGNYSALVTIPDDDGDEDITLTVTGTAVIGPTEPTTPSTTTSPPTSDLPSDLPSVPTFLPEPTPEPEDPVIE
ncbi:hypothetical protein ACFYO2_19590 [Streptomyces sp. NPDC006602]|uniref:hypothetical protein n=1 Tax=Streptomyces sp. NPDC006602 TaxID=3364751 RepID=UPI00368468EF